MFCEFPRIKQRLWGGKLWEDGYFARTVEDRVTRQIVDKYIRCTSENALKMLHGFPRGGSLFFKLC
jgi:REP element-mobilizing transposase RayT